MHRDEKLIRSIAGDVMTVLQKQNVFETLDELMCPGANLLAVNQCDGTHRLTQQILVDRQFDRAAIDDVLNVLNSLGWLLRL
jgi:hypothetical protein